MKAIQKGLVILVAGLFMSSVFAAGEVAKTSADHMAKGHHHGMCVKKCHGAKHKKHCKKMMHHKKMMKKAKA